MLDSVEELLTVLGSRRLKSVKWARVAGEEGEFSQIVERPAHAGHAVECGERPLGLHGHERRPAGLLGPRGLFGISGQRWGRGNRSAPLTLTLSVT